MCVCACVYVHGVCVRACVCVCACMRDCVCGCVLGWYATVESGPWLGPQWWATGYCRIINYGNTDVHRVFLCHEF